jgi:ribosome-associated translation inhibitor RaiA
MSEFNKHYWEVGRNGYVSDTSYDTRIPSYYIGKYHKYEARKVVEDFELTYNVGTAVTYLLRAQRKHDTPIDCIQKAINHLEFELEKLKQ